MSESIRVAELFAGVGGFRLALEGYHDPARPELDMPSAGPYQTVWANQWEPPGTDGKQFAWRCYESRFGKDSCVNEDIHKVLDACEAGEYDIPDVDMVVGGYPCQDYSVAHTLKSARGIEGKKGVLWWEIYRFLQLKSPRFCLFENVDRLLKSPAGQRGRDFAIMLSCLMSLGYSVEWRVVNSAAYGFSQRRKRVYIFADRCASWVPSARLADGVMARAYPYDFSSEVDTVHIADDPYAITKDWQHFKQSPFLDAGVACDGIALTVRAAEVYDGRKMVLGDVVVDADNVPPEYWVSEEQIPKWSYLKGAKRERRVASNGHEYWYSEGQMAFPDLLSNPSRTILTGEGGAGASRFKHIIKQGGRYRRLVPDELDLLQGFPKGWTDAGMSDTRRAFCMGNALVVGVVGRIGQTITEMYAS